MSSETVCIKCSFVGEVTVYRWCNVDNKLCERSQFLSDLTYFFRFTAGLLKANIWDLRSMIFVAEWMPFSPSPQCQSTGWNYF